MMSPSFVDVDNLMQRLDEAVQALNDDYYKSRFIGYVAVSAVTAYEINIRNKVVHFCSKKHKVFGHFSGKIFEKTNARIRISMLRDDVLSRFGEQYLKRFNRKLNEIEKEKLASGDGSVKNSYANLIQWRHDFVHEGVLPQYAGYEEARKSYELGKNVIKCFYETLVR